MRLETCIRKSLGLRSHYVREIREEDGQLIASIDRLGARRLDCGQCGRAAMTVSGRRPPRDWRDLPIRGQPLVLRYAPYRVRCRRCGVRVERLPWARPWQRVTTALAVAVAALARRLSWAETATHFGLDWKTVAGVVRRAVTEGLARRRWQPLHVLGIDEVSRRKGHQYLTLIYDLERGRLVWIGENRDTATMERFLTWLGPRRARAVRAVCCDMWAPYIDAVRRGLRGATVVFDRFHVVRHLNAAVDAVRRQMWRALRGQTKAAFKRTRWLWLKNPWNLKPDHKRRLSALCRLNLPIVRAYYLKEAFQRFWDYRYPGWAIPYLRQWLWWASHSRLEPFKQFARMIRAHLDGILAWTWLRISNGALEGMNNKVKVVSHRAYGFRKTDTYVTAIWHACGNLPLPA